MWFAGNAIMPDLVREFDLDPGYLAHITSAVQFGFITGTLVFAILSIPDRFSPSKVFLISSIIAAGFNVAITLGGIHVIELMSFRFLTGFFLAGIYPVGMKIAADYYQQELGKSLGWLLGALVLGTSFPHLLRSMTTALPWKYVLYTTSILSLSGGVAIRLLVPDGPHRTQGQRPKWSGFLKGFRHQQFRAAAFGYFGHMWELYTFWAFLPVILATYKAHFPGHTFDISLLSFLIIASGAIACVIGGMISLRIGARKVANGALLISCLCCLASPFFLLNNSFVLLLVFLFIWGMTVIADSPMFSTLVAQNAPAETKGASLTIVISIGFALTIGSIQLVNALLNSANAQYIYLLLAPGPILGLIAMMRGKKA
jgi:MFS family permease